MLHHREKCAGKPLFSVSPTYQIRKSYDSTEDIEFDFWGAGKTGCYENLSDQSSGSNIELQAQDSIVGESSGAYSSSSWKISTTRKVDYESYPLLPHNHHYSNLSPKSRKEAIAEGRMQLMEMVQDMPESCYELSLKDIVDEQNILEDVKEGSVIEESTEPQIKKQKKKKKKKKGISKAGQVSRIQSMDSETFLLKMFFPIPQSLKKKAKAGNSLQVSPMPSFECTTHHTKKEWWMKKFFVAGESKRSRANCMNGSNRSRNSSTSRYLSNFTKMFKRCGGGGGGVIHSPMEMIKQTLVSNLFVRSAGVENKYN